MSTSTAACSTRSAVFPVETVVVIAFIEVWPRDVRDQADRVEEAGADREADPQRTVVSVVW